MIILLIAFVLVITILTYKFANLIIGPVFVDHILCEIEYGQNARSIAHTLYEQNIIKNEKLFYIMARLKGLDKDLKAGFYLFYGDLNMLDTVNKIYTGEIIVEKVIIPEGSSMYRTLKTLANYEIGDYDRMLSLANDRDFIYNLTGFPVDKLEGFLYPDTYIFSYNMQEENILNVITNNFFNKLNEANIDLTDKDKLYKDIILASIVEKEVIYSNEKPIVSSVYNNRIKKGMRLQADPTVTYHLEPDFIHKKRLTYKDTRHKSPHNTYVINGLPPTPICSPSIESIIAAQNPDSTNYYFFFANRYGRHIFSETYSQHLRKQRSRRY